MTSHPELASKKALDLTVKDEQSVKKLKKTKHCTCDDVKQQLLSRSVSKPMIQS